MQWYKADLHMHSVLSPCGGLEMSPNAVVEKALAQRIDILAITDHNSMANCSAYRMVAEKAGIHFIFGVEIQTAEEIHLIALFDDATMAMEFNEELYASLLPIANDPEFFGDQVVIDEHENIVRCEERALLNSSLWTLDDAVDKVKEYNGFCFPAHVDATTFSIIGQLGFIPDNLAWTAVGVSAQCKRDVLLQAHPQLAGYHLIRSSDAHYLNDIGSGYAMFYLEEPSVHEIMLACAHEAERKVWNEKDKLK